MILNSNSLSSWEESAGVRWAFFPRIPIETPHGPGTHLTRFAALTTLSPLKGGEGPHHRFVMPALVAGIHVHRHTP